MKITLDSCSRLRKELGFYNDWLDGSSDGPLNALTTFGKDDPKREFLTGASLVKMVIGELVTIIINKIRNLFPEAAEPDEEN